MSKSVNVDFVTRQIEVDTDGKEHFISAAMAAKDAEASMLNAQNAATQSETALSLIQKHKAVWFDSVTDMKANLDLTAKTYACTAGYYAPNDGGGASYLIRAKAESDVDDGGSLHELQNGLVAELIVENGTVYPEQFGAVGDGVTDDTQAIQNAIDSGVKHIIFKENAKYLVSQIVLKDGVYDFNGCTILRKCELATIVNENIDKFGGGATYQGQDSIRQAVLNGDTNTIVVLNLVVENADNIIKLTEEQIRTYLGFRWLSGDGHIDTFPINFVGLYNSLIQNVKITFPSENANINLGFSLNTVVSLCELNNGIDNSLQFFACLSSTARNNTFINGGGGLLVMQACYSCVFDNNYVLYTSFTTGVNNYMISIKGSKWCSVINNRLECTNAQGMGIVFSQQDGETEHCVCMGNTIRNCLNGIVCDYATTNGIIISDNIIYNSSNQSSWGAITLREGKNYKVDNNIISDSVYPSIAIGNADCVYITNNRLNSASAPNIGIAFITVGGTSFNSLNYKVKNNQIISGNSSIKFDNNTYIKFRHYLITDNICNNGIYRSETNVEWLTEFNSKYVNLSLKVGYLSQGIVINNDYNITFARSSNGVYTLTLPFYMQIHNLNTNYHLGYNAGDLQQYSIGCAYDDNSNAQKSSNTISVVLRDSSGTATDNPTTNPNASNNYNFGLTFEIYGTVDYDNWA